MCTLPSTSSYARRLYVHTNPLFSVILCINEVCECHNARRLAAKHLPRNALWILHVLPSVPAWYSSQSVIKYSWNDVVRKHCIKAFSSRITSLYTFSVTRRLSMSDILVVALLIFAISVSQIGRPYLVVMLRSRVDITVRSCSRELGIMSIWHRISFLYAQ